MGEQQFRVWCLLGRKAGDNTQVRALAGALGWGFDEKQIRARPWELLVHALPAPTLAGIDRGESSALTPPWPDLVISAGRRNEPVAQWIRAQSGGQTRLVHLGRPWAPLASWDLIITTPQYFLPQAANILHIRLPLHTPLRTPLRTPPAAEDTAQTDVWQARFAALPRPWIAVLIGGDSGRFVFTRAKGERLGRLSQQLAQAAGGALLVSDSPRTPSAVMQGFAGRLGVPHAIYRCAAGGENPYRAMLALADAFVVTGESMSMLAEAADTKRPLFIFDPGDADTPWWRLAHNYRYKPLSFRFAMRFGPPRMRRDVGRIQAGLMEAGKARWLDDQSVAGAGAALDSLPGVVPCTDAAGDNAQADLAASVEAVRRLLIRP
ncbi:MAG: ELM1/GtrOC1 family putative glycosyltransferase [Halioglobus sp.]